jgi:outer membrane protein TolC
MRKTRFLSAPLVTAMAAAMLSACAVGPNYHAPQTKAAEKFDSLEATYSGGEGVAQFWQTFADTELDKLVNEALASNHDLRIALTRVREARALRRDSAFDLAPSINAGGGYTKTRNSRLATLSSTSSAVCAAESRPAMRSSAPWKPGGATRRSS